MGSGRDSKMSTENEQRDYGEYWDCWNAESGGEPVPRTRRESWDRWNDLVSQGKGIPAVYAIMGTFREQNVLGGSFPHRKIGGFTCPLCGVHYETSPRSYVNPPAVQCKGCRGDSVQARVISDLFLQVIQGVPLEDLYVWADLFAYGTPAVSILDRISILEDRRDRNLPGLNYLGFPEDMIPYADSGCSVPVDPDIPPGDLLDMEGGYIPAGSVNPEPLFWDSADPRGMPDSYRIGGEDFRVYSVTPGDLDMFGTLEESDIGRLYILVSGCIQFVDMGYSGVGVRK